MRISDWSSDVCSSDLWSDLTLEQRAEKVGAARDYCAGQIDRLVELSANELGLPVAQNKPRHLASLRSEERRVGKECVSTCRSRWSPYHYKKNKIQPE